jgi:hypothetical protein
MPLDGSHVLVVRSSRNEVRQRCGRCKQPVVTATGKHLHLAGHQTSLTERDGKPVLQGLCANRDCRFPYLVTDIAALAHGNGEVAVSPATGA